MKTEFAACGAARGGPFGVDAEALLGGLRIFVEVRGEVDHHIVIGNARDIVGVEHVAVRAAREIIGGEKMADVHAEIAAAARDKYVHLSSRGSSIRNRKFVVINSDRHESIEGAASDH